MNLPDLNFQKLIMKTRILTILLTTAVLSFTGCGKINDYRELQKKVKTLESENKQLQGDLKKANEKAKSFKMDQKEAIEILFE